MTIAPFISVISLAVLVFLTVVLLIDRRRPPGTIYLLILLIILGLVITLRLLFDLQSELIIYLPFLVFPAGFLYGPCIFLYTETALFGHRVTKIFWAAILLAPAAVLSLHALLHNRFPEMQSVHTILAQAGVLLPYSRALVLAGVAYSLLFVVLAVRNLRRYEVAYKENFAGNDRDQLTWLKTLLALNVGLLVSFGGAVMVSAIFDLKIPVTPVEGIVAMLMIYVILYYFISKPAVFALPDTVVAPKTNNEKYRKQNLSESERRSYIEKIENYVAEEKPFLDDKVTLASLARELGIPAHHLSMVINIERNTNFYNFINSYRVAEAKRLLQDPQMADETVLDIALMAGFQSKAGFNKVFKEITGLTPSAYREQAIYRTE